MAQGTYTITGDVVPGREYSDDYGAKRVYMVALEGVEAESDTGKFELHKKQASKAPQAGDTLEVKRFQKGDFQGAKFTRIFQEYTEKHQSGGGGGGRRSGDEGPGLTWQSKPFERGAEHPRNEARAIHTSALSSTPAFIEQMLTVGVVDQPKTEDEYWKLVGKVATKLTRSYEAAMEPQQRLPVAGGEVPADTAGLERKQAPADDVPFN